MTIPMSEINDRLLGTISLALERIKNLEVLILSWEDRLRSCELRPMKGASSPADGSAISSASSFGDGESITLGPLMRGAYAPRDVRCAVKTCSELVMPEKRFCRRHISRACHFAGCTKTRLGAEFCIRHGGGKRCEVPGCAKGASGTVGGGARFCIAHGGGRRCRVEGCKSTAKRDGLCSSHGGRYECVVPGCSKTAHGPRRLCAMHAGGRPTGAAISSDF